MPAIPRNERAKSVTLYLSDDVINRIAIFAERTVRSKSQSAEYLIRIGMEQFIELGQDAPVDAPAMPKKTGRKRKPRSVDTVRNPEAPKQVVTQPAAESKPARKPRAKKPVAKPGTAKKPAARKPRARKAATA